MSDIRRTKGEIIPTDAYPQPVEKQDASHVIGTLRSVKTHERAARVIAEKQESLREVIRRYVCALEAVSGNTEAIFAIAHEVRGFAATANLAATGRIADGLCRYLDKMHGTGAVPDDILTRLHVSAMVRAAHAEDEASRTGELVAAELAMLVKRRMNDLQEGGNTR